MKIIKKISKLLFVFCFFILLSVSADAEGERKLAEWQKTDGLITSGIYTYRITDEAAKEIELRGINSSESNIIIPGEIDGYKVVSIGYAYFIYVPYDSEVDSACEIIDENELKPLQVSGCSETITQVTIPDGVRTIGAAAFLNFKNLKKVKLSDTVTDIREMAFKGCSALQPMDIPVNASLGDETFFDCSNIHKITLSTSNLSGVFELFDGQKIKELHIVKSKYDKIGDSYFEISNYTFGGGINNVIDKVTVESGVNAIELNLIGIKKLIIKGKDTRIKCINMGKDNINQTNVYTIKGAKAVKFARNWKVKYYAYKKAKGSKEAVRYTYKKKTGWKSVKKKMRCDLETA